MEPPNLAPANISKAKEVARLSAAQPPVFIEPTNAGGDRLLCPLQVLYSWVLHLASHAKSGQENLYYYIATTLL